MPKAFDPLSLAPEERPWIFISYSNHDILKARAIRNYFEKAGAEPILFYLKGEQNCPQEELLALIQKEISAREYFIYLDSPFARVSPYVQQELSDLKACRKEIFLKIAMENLTLDPSGLLPGKKESEDLAHHLDSLFKLDRIFISAPHLLDHIERKIKDLLLKHGFHPQEEDPLAGDNWTENVEDTIDASDFILALVDKNSLCSNYWKFEIDHAIVENKTIIPLFINEIPPMVYSSTEGLSLIERQGLIFYPEKDPNGVELIRSLICYFRSL
ncbi:MAG: toll/interleukin-1 receptor domain-containing protein [Bacilli bacterium]|jgi:hypothetical protein|nr:toll/interleukin-1 receptor domain-containing protein [Bacilli bacterium]